MIIIDAIFGNDGNVLRDPSFQLLLLANLLPPLGTAMLSPVLVSLIEPFGTTNASIGLLVSVFTAPAIVITPLAGAFADRYGRKPTIVGSLLLFGTAGTAITFTTDFRFVLGFRLLQGIAYGGLTPIIITSIGDLYAGTEESTAQGLRFTVSGLSQMVFPFVAGLLVTVAWQFPFLLYGAAIPIAIHVLLFFKEPSEQGSQPAPNGVPDESYFNSLIQQLRQPHVFVLVLARGLPLVVWIAFLTYNSIFVVQFLDGTPGQAGLLVGVGSLCYAVASSQTGRITELFDSQYIPLLVANGLLLVGFNIVLFAPSFLFAFVGIAISGVGFGTLLSLYRSLITNLVPPYFRAGIVSIAEANGRLVATITPLAMGVVITVWEPTIGFSSALQLAGVGATLIGGGGGIICLLVLNKSHLVVTTYTKSTSD